MTHPAVLWNHRHVSERESAHYWPDGRWDNARYEDCFWDVLVEFVRACLRADIAATHYEAERLRQDAGEDTSSGSHSGDGNKGLRKRYSLGPLETHSDADVLNMPIGFAASIAGSMGVFSWGHPLRRWDREFRGSHRVFVVRVKGGTGWWWCDPLAPAGYEGEYISRADLQRFMGGLPFGDHFIRPLLPKPAVPVHDPTPIGTVRVKAGVSFFIYDVNGNPTAGYDATTRSEPKTTQKGFSATVGREITWRWKDEDRRWVHITDPKSAYEGAWVDLNAGGISLVVT